MNRMIRIVAAASLTIGAIAVGAGGCEVIASIDRSKIPSSAGGGGAAASSSTGGSSTGGSGGGCTGSACVRVSDCPLPSSDCVVPSCDTSCCSETSKPSGATCASQGGSVCDDQGHCVACDKASDCPAQSSACVVNTCSNHVCGTENAAANTACTDDNGAVCDGSGHCVACNKSSDCGGSLVCDTATHTCVGCTAPGDCPAQTTACRTNTCTAGTCGVADAAEGTSCTDDSGSVCNATGSCVACNTSTDCTNNQVCDTATNTCVACLDSGDCAPGACNSGVFSPAETCNGNHQCVPGTDQTCSMQCSPTLGCVECLGGGDCAASSCTNDVFHPAETCDASGACQAGTAQTCPMSCDPSTGCVGCNGPGDCTDSCSNGQLSPATCTNQVCGLGTAAACPGNVKCASTSACLPSCSNDNDCQSSSDYCSGGACVPKGADGAACSAADQCTSGRCGTTGSGHCCTAACSASVPACGATDCNTSGACVYPGNTTAPAGLQTPGDCQKIVCNGSGGVTSADDATDLPVSNSQCLTNPACCGPSPLTPCFSDAATGSPCTDGGDPAARVCGDTSNSNIAGTCVECNADSDCLAVNDAGVLVCDTSVGSCAACVPSGHTVGSAGECASACCNGACSSGTTCQ